MSGSAAANHANERKRIYDTSTTTSAISDHEAAASLMRSVKRSDDGGGGNGSRTTTARPPPPNSKRSRTTTTSRPTSVRGRPAQDTSYYGPPVAGKIADGTGASTSTSTTTTTSVVVAKQKANFGLSGALVNDGIGTTGGDGSGRRLYKGVPLKFQEPPEARTPQTLWRFYVFKGDEQIDTLHVARQSAYLFGRHEDICDVHIAHPSCSTQHAVLQYRAVPNASGKISCQPYLLDLESTNGTFINGVRIDAARYYQLKKGDVIRFGSSQREYVLLTADTKSKNKK